MITTIITIVASVVLTLMVGFFIWLGVSVRKLKKDVKDNEQYIKNLDENLAFLDELNQDKFKDVYDNINERFDEIYNSVDDRSMSSQRELDRRFDKVYKKINSEEDKNNE